MINNNRILENFLALTLIDGIHGNEYSISMELISRLKALGLEVKSDDAGKSYGGNTGNIIARLDGSKDITPIFLCSHMDTIQSTKNLVHVVKDGVISSDGSTILGGDNRAGIAVILEIIETIIEKNLPHGKIEIIFTVCEEAGMFGAKFLNKNDLESEMGFVFDSQASPGCYIVEAPGAVSFNASIKGKPAHAAVSPEKGIHAIQIASKAIANMKLGRWAETGMLNIGTINGGKSINVIPDLVEITGETRNANEIELKSQVDYIKDVFNTAAEEMGGEAHLTFNEKYGGYQFREDELVVKIARSAISKAGLVPKPIKYPGGSDANVLNKKGLKALNLGVGFNNAHSFQEFIPIQNLINTAVIGMNIIEQSVYNSKGNSFS